MKRFVMSGLIVALIAVGVTMGCGDGEAEPTPTPMATPEITPTPTPTPTTGDGEVATASSIDFTITVEPTGGEPSTYRYRARNLGTSSLDIRVDCTIQGIDISYILKGSSQEGWIYTGGVWYSFADMFYNFSEWWDIYSDNLEEYHGYLAEEWAQQQEWTYTVPGVGTVTYSNITLNPTLPDSVFQPD